MRRRMKRRKKNNGVIVKEATGPALGAAVVSLLRNATRRSLLGKEARATARRRFTIEHMNRQYMDLYRHLLFSAD